MPNWNPFTWLFSRVSCPNYTYELLFWIRKVSFWKSCLISCRKFYLSQKSGYWTQLMKLKSFTIMTNCAVAGINTLIVFMQLFVWATRKHKNYKQRFLNYPNCRKAFIPYIYWFNKLYRYDNLYINLEWAVFTAENLQNKSQNSDILFDFSSEIPMNLKSLKMKNSNRFFLMAFI